MNESKLSLVSPLPDQLQESIVQSLEFLLAQAKKGNIKQLVCIYNVKQGVLFEDYRGEIGQDCYVAGSWTAAEILYWYEQWKFRLMNLHSSIVK